MKRQKLYYVPGFISLLCLPVLLLLSFPEEPVRQTKISLVVPTDEKPRPGINSFSKYGVFQEVKNKHIISVELEKDVRYDKGLYNYHAKRRLINHEIERLTYTHETTSVLKVNFGETATYGDLISILNQILICGVKRYALVDNSLYIFANEPPPSSQPEVIYPAYAPDY
jgi:hypothetical protein